MTLSSTLSAASCAEAAFPTIAEAAAMPADAVVAALHAGLRAWTKCVGCGW